MLFIHEWIIIELRFVLIALPPEVVTAPLLVQIMLGDFQLDVLELLEWVDRVQGLPELLLVVLGQLVLVLINILRQTLRLLVTRNTLLLLVLLILTRERWEVFSEYSELEFVDEVGLRLTHTVEQIVVERDLAAVTAAHENVLILIHLDKLVYLASKH